MKPVLNIEFEEDFDYFLDQQGSSCESLSHVLMVNFMTQPNCYPHNVQVFHIFYNDISFWIPILWLAINVAAVFAKKKIINIPS